MQSVMNLKIKYRESFRPFAPSVLKVVFQGFNGRFRLLQFLLPLLGRRQPILLFTGLVMNGRIVTKVSCLGLRATKRETSMPCRFHP
jgi:hypothetical protein